MAYPVTLNGRTYTLADFAGTNYVDGFPDALEDFVTQAGNIYTTTSTSSVAIGTGSKTFTVADSGKPYIVGTPLRIADSAAPSTNWIDGIVTSYSGTTLVVDAVAYAGSGTKTAWNINIGGSAIAYTGTLPIAQGGTGGTTAAAARTNLDVYSKSEADGRYINVTGDGMTSNLTFGDNVKATFGASADLEIFHDGAASYIRDAGTGNLRLEGNVVVADSPDSNDGKITFGDATNAQGVVFYDYSLGDLFIENTWADATADIVLKANSAETMRSNSTGTVFNEASANMDFRVESDNNAHMLFVDAGSDKIYVGSASSPSTSNSVATSLVVSDIAEVGTGMFQGRVPNTANNNNGFIKIFNLTTANASNVGCQFSGRIIFNSYTGCSIVDINFTKHYSNDSVSWTVISTVDGNSSIAGVNCSLVTATVSGQSFLGIQKTGGGTGAAYINAFVQGEVHTQIYEELSANYTVTATHTTLIT